MTVSSCATNLRNIQERETNILDDILEMGKQKIARLRSFFSWKTDAILKGDSSPSFTLKVPNQSTQKPVIPYSVVSSKVLKSESLDFTVRTHSSAQQKREPTSIRVEKLNGGISAEQKELYKNYRKGLSKDDENFSIARLALSETFVFDTLSRVLKKFAQKAMQENDQETLSRFIPPKEPILRYIAHIIFVLRQTIIGSVIPTETEVQYIRAILSDEQIKEHMVASLGEKDSHARVQALRAPKVRAIQHPLIQSLVGNDTALSEKSLGHLFGNFSQYFPENTEMQRENHEKIEEKSDDTSSFIPMSLRKKTTVTEEEKLSAIIIPFKNAITMEREKQNLSIWNKMSLWDTPEKISLSSTKDFFALVPIDETFPHIVQKHGPCTYSVEKLSIGDYMTKLSQKKSFDHMLRGVFKTPELKQFNSRPEIRIPAAIFSDIMDGTPILWEERVLVSEVLSNKTFARVFTEAFEKLQSDPRIGTFNIIRYPHVNGKTILSFFENKMQQIPATEYDTNEKTSIAA
ncbi:MAG: hypothetical protein ACD_71C00124G0003 [uncultured bacterium (gcode 4)]|uniref:Uncharacterized protein n=1 Tax=uncultured bacterium (gcode 4) TaxID=1234023 RepID=K1Z5C0_9BACT|nr:MAG: hypothetical protein ACD_71C00124G0003 [uncultured bacterium (gcode 4)]